ncbi:hypothetical protein YC2023_107229 [Brassica napus]
MLMSMAHETHFCLLFTFFISVSLERFGVAFSHFLHPVLKSHKLRFGVPLQRRRFGFGSSSDVDSACLFKSHKLRSTLCNGFGFCLSNTIILAFTCTTSSTLSDKSKVTASTPPINVFVACDAQTHRSEIRNENIFEASTPTMAILLLLFSFLVRLFGCANTRSNLYVWIAIIPIVISKTLGRHARRVYVGAWTNVVITRPIPSGEPVAGLGKINERHKEALKYLKDFKWIRVEEPIEFTLELFFVAYCTEEQRDCRLRDNKQEKRACKYLKDIKWNKVKEPKDSRLIFSLIRTLTTRTLSSPRHIT